MSRMIARVVILIVFMGFAVGAQVHAVVREPTDPRRFDAFGKLGHCDLGARLDNFAIALQQEPETVGHIIAYAPEGDGPGTGKLLLKLMKDYLLEARGLPKRRVNTIYAGRNQVLYEPKFELWITPKGATAPDPPKFETNIDTFKGLFVEDETADYIDLLWADEMGPGIGLSIDAAFADLLRQQKNAVPYIVTYIGESAVPGSAQRAAASQIEALKGHKVDVSRIRTIFGGVRKKTLLQLWITAPGDPPPVKEAGAEPLPLKNAHITEQGDYILRVPENERAVFNRLLAVLRTQPLVKVVAIVTLEAPQEELSEVEENDPPVDLPKMVQKWHDELVNTHKIRAERFVVLFATAEPEMAGGYINLWAVPPGQPLPDPNADEEKEPSDIVQDPKRRP